MLNEVDSSQSSPTVRTTDKLQPTGDNQAATPKQYYPQGGGAQASDPRQVLSNATIKINVPVNPAPAATPSNPPQSTTTGLWLWLILAVAVAIIALAYLIKRKPATLNTLSEEPNTATALPERPKKKTKAKKVINKAKKPPKRKRR